ncbi:GNAT family N-acetyltransferase [Deinococcus humi]|uniref:RimJ/RimL family protein N-acetyltransferase n=1 Tax=Deinococcus humi TaxID=662880 RepID=A0A7W8JQX3_9DEIO|nr:GNAT family protein [Deinococcus humi]MBB5361193.1 RimJ/RimL family protein N-acetyltransferase [Deinococcus humi]GGO18856.1 ribosomal protein N-acetyltransferase [Deinococcus humi]
MTAPPVPTELRTPRLWLRAPREQDAGAVHAAVHASLPELQPWMVWAQQPDDLAGTARNLREAAERYAAREELRLLVWNADGSELIGSSGFHALNWSVPKGEIGYWIASAHTGQGHAQEVAGALTEFGLNTLGLRRIEIRCDSANERSARIPRRLGYTLDATLKNNAVAADDPNQLRDTLVFSVVR